MQIYALYFNSPIKNTNCVRKQPYFLTQIKKDFTFHHPYGKDKNKAPLVIKNAESFCSVLGFHYLCNLK